MIVRKIARRSADVKKRVAAYCRVSTDKAEQEESFETQKAAYERMIRANPEWEYAGIYADEKSGTSANRVGFQRMIQDALAGKIDYILVKSISRFSRNVVDCRAYLERLAKRNVTVYFERENIESTAPGTNMMLSLMAAIAQDESHSNSENHLWAVRKRYERGEYKLGNNQLMGYDADENGKPIPNGDAWIVRMIFQLFVEGKTVNEIVRQLEAAGARGLRSGKPLKRENVNYILRNEVYVGDRLLQKRHPKNYLTKRPDPRREKVSRYMREMHGGLIDRETWERAQARLAAEDKARERERAAGMLRRREGAHFLTGVALCEECGRVLCRRTIQGKRDPEGNGGTCGSEKSHIVWKCKGRIHKSETAGGESGNSRCDAPILREDALLAELQRQLEAAGIACGDGGLEEAVKRQVERVLVGKRGITVVLTKGEKPSASS